MKEEIQKTEIRMAEVRARFDPNQAGVFYAGIDGISDGASLMINYVSPYGSAAKAGFIGVPEVGASILVCKPSGSNEWFYIGSTFLPEDKKQGECTPTTPPFSRVDPKINKVSGVPAKVILHGNNGQGLEISDEQDGKTTNNIKTELTSSNGKKITMHDSPGIDAIKLDSGNNASITLTQNPQNNPQKSAASIEVDCNGPQLHVCRESDLEMKVLGGGRELNIQNSANGVAWGNFQHQSPINPVGNVNVQSDWGDVNIMSKSPLMGRIFIETVNPAGQTQLIQLKTNSAAGGIVLQTNGTLAIDATNIAMNSRGNVAIGCNGLFSVEALGGMAVQTPAKIDLEGAIVNLAPGVAPTIPVEPIIAATTATPLNINDYFGRGLE